MQVNDSRGVTLRIGDTVQLTGVVTQLFPGSADGGCNAQVRIASPRGEYAPEIACSSRSIERTAAGAVQQQVASQPQEAVTSNV